jgi:hypothetical protein
MPPVVASELARKNEPGSFVTYTLAVPPFTV